MVYFLLYDFVHILKAVRNNWITEKCKKLSFEDDGKIKHVSWAHIIDLYRHEQEHLVKLSKLTNVSVFPRPIERQKVSTCLKIFCDETITGLKTMCYWEASLPIPKRKCLESYDRGLGVWGLHFPDIAKRVLELVSIF